MAVFLDDVQVSDEQRRIMTVLAKMLHKMTDEAWLRLNRDICQFKLHQVTYLGHRISEDGVQPTKEKIVVIMNTLSPTDRKH